MDTLKFPVRMTDDSDVIKALKSLNDRMAETNEALKTLAVKPPNGNSRKLVTLQNLFFTILISVIGFLLITQKNHGEQLSRVDEALIWFVDRVDGIEIRLDRIERGGGGGGS